MKKRFWSIIILILISVFIIFPAVKAESQKKENTQKNWKDIKTVSDVCAAYPERIETMLKSMNLNLKGLEKVKSAYIRGNIEIACQALVDYYNKGTTAGYLRKDLPTSSKRETLRLIQS